MSGWEHPSIVELLEQLYAFDESDRVEVKAGSEIGKSILETVVAFANEPNLGGGYLILGIAEDKSNPKRYEVIGVTDLDKLKNDLSSQCRSTLNATVRIRSWAEEVDGKTVLAFYVPEADSNLKPIYRKAVGLPKGAFRRGPSGDIRCVDQDIKELYRQKNATEFDTTIPADAEMDDIDPEAVNLYRTERAKANPSAEELGWSDAELLKSLGCVKRERGQLKPTVSGVLLFGKQTALRRLMPAVRVDYIRVSGREWIENPHHRFDTVDLRDSLFRLIRRSVAAVMDDLPIAFNLPQGEIARKDRPVLPVDVVREAVVNALMHRNYQKHQPVQIIRYANRLEVRNPGYSLKPFEQLGEPGSISRNPAIAAILHETHLAETKGSGIRVMRTLMEKAGLELPQFHSDRHGDEFRATYLFHHFLSEQDLEWLARFNGINLTDDQRKALVYARETGRVSNKEYRELNKVNIVEASQELCGMRDLGVLESKGSGRATYYVLSDEYASRERELNLLDMLALVPEDGMSLPEEKASKSGKLVNKSDEFTQKPVNPETNYVDQPGTTRKLTIPRDAIIEGLRKSYEKRLGITANKPLRGDNIRRVVRYLCSQRACTASQLANAVEKNPQYLKEAYIFPMIKAGELEYLYPDKLNHPKQAYRTSRKTEDEDQ